MLLPGKKVAEKILVDTKNIIVAQDLKPGLGVILIGDDAPSHLYVGIKEKRASELGITFLKKTFGSHVDEQSVVEAIALMNNDPHIHGIIVQLPLPDHLDTDRIIASIEPSKDTDGFHPETITKFLDADTSRLPVFPRAMIELVRSAPKADRKKGLALTNSILMGQVLAQALRDEGLEAEYVVKNQNEKREVIMSDADVILSATGEPASLSSMACKAGVVIIDGGISYDDEGRVIGDVARDDGVYRKDVWVTPVPGGVGPVTVAVLLARVTEAALRQNENTL